MAAVKGRNSGSDRFLALRVVPEVSYRAFGNLLPFDDHLYSSKTLGLEAPKPVVRACVNR